jgi:hypothetical protein
MVRNNASMGSGKKAQNAKDVLFKWLYGVKPAAFNKYGDDYPKRVQDVT